MKEENPVIYKQLAIGDVLRYVGEEEIATLNDKSGIILSSHRNIKPNEILILLTIAVIDKDRWPLRLELLTTTGISWLITDELELAEIFRKIEP